VGTERRVGGCVRCLVGRDVHDRGAARARGFSHADGRAAGRGSVRWQASGSGGAGPREFEFWRLDPDGWHLAQPYGSSASYTWAPGVTDVGSHAIQVWMRDVGSMAPYEAWAGTRYFTILPPPLLPVMFTSAPAVPARVGTPLTWIASAGMSGVEYQVYRLDPVAGWSVVQPYSSQSSYTWTPTSADVGTHALQIWARRVDPRPPTTGGSAPVISQFCRKRTRYFGDEMPRLRAEGSPQPSALHVSPTRSSS
jgi:hypothetical protein